MRMNVSKQLISVIGTRIHHDFSWVDYRLGDCWSVHNACDVARCKYMKKLTKLAPKKLIQWL